MADGLFSISVGPWSPRVLKEVGCLTIPIDDKTPMMASLKGQIAQTYTYTSGIKSIHCEMGKQVWDVEFRVLCCTDSSISFIWKFFVETIFIILIQTLDTTALHQFQDVHVIGLVKSLEPCPNASDDAASRLNKCLPIFQGFFPAPQDRKAALGKKYYWCGCNPLADY